MKAMCPFCGKADEIDFNTIEFKTGEMIPNHEPRTCLENIKEQIWDLRNEVGRVQLKAMQLYETTLFWGTTR